MSTGKRIAKRSILGTRVVAPGIDGRFYPAVIQSPKTYGDSYVSENRYLVRFDNSRKVSEFGESELIGPGFSGVSAVGTLLSGQRVYLTHGGREVEGTVCQHDVKADIVTVNMSIGEPLTVRADEIRLLESRKSNRLMVRQTSVQDFSKLADYNFVHDRRRGTERRRLNSEISSNSDSSEVFGSRKRRGSETVSEEGSSSEEYYRLRRLEVEVGGPGAPGGSGAHGVPRDSRTEFLAVKKTEQERSSSPVMSECTAALVLMDLYGSPVSRSSHLSGYSDGSSGQMSPSSSGVSSLGSSWNSPTLTPPFPLPSDSPVSALLELSGDYTVEKSDSDEGIVSDHSFECDENKKIKKTESVRVIFQCTWRNCNHQETQCQAIEAHVRQVHLGRSQPTEEEEEEHEEEFYYTEFEIPDAEDIPEDSLVVEDGDISPHARTDSSSLSDTSSSTTSSQPQERTIMMDGHRFLPPSPIQGPTILPILADHCDMARPPHENPEYTAQRTGCAQLLSSSTPTYATIISPSSSLGLPIAIPITTFTISGGGVPGKYIRLSPKPCPSTSPKSPVRRPRGDAKKCRKVYGMEQRDLWCTQCKWKKACTRFGEAETMNLNSYEAQTN